MKEKILLIYGGISAEHDVSIASAKNVNDFINKNKYQITLLYINKNGQWCIVNEIQDSTTNTGVPVVIDMESKTINGLKYDKAFPVMHGPYGEDGQIQGMLRVLGIPFVGSDIMASACAMNKITMKKLFQTSLLPVGLYIHFNKDDYQNNTSDYNFEKITSQLGLPIFIKPASMGSSIGISKVKNELEYTKAIEEAFKYDKQIILEKYIKGRELEVGVLETDNEIKVSVIGEVVTDYTRHDFYNYEAKYKEGNTGVSMIVPAKIQEKVSEDIKSMALLAFRSLSCRDLARVDFFYADDGKVYINEINTMPGFTNTSMYTRLWSSQGISTDILIDKLII